MLAQLKAFRCSFLDFIDDPFHTSELESIRYIMDGLLVIENGLVKELGDYESLHAKYVGIEITSYPGMLIMPGFIDTHVHFPQTEAIASYGEQ
nr:guanine deaminase [Tatlockia sp.]